MRRTPWRAVSFVLILGLASMSCNGPSRGSNTQPSSASGLFISLVVSPNTLRGAPPGSTLSSNGGCAVAQAKVSDTSGNLVDGANVSMSAGLGVFVVGTQQLAGVAGQTTRGFFQVTYCAQSERGTAIITARVEDAFDTALVTIF